MRVLQRERSTKSCLIEVVNAFSEFCIACPSEESVTLSGCCKFQAKLEKTIQKMKRLPPAELPVWNDSLLWVFKRFSKGFTDRAPAWIQAILKEKGVEVAGNYLFGCENLPPKLKMYKSILVQASFLQALKVPEPLDKKDPNFFQEMGSRLKSYVTLKSLDHDGIAFLFPEVSDVATQYQEAVKAQTMKIVGKVEKWNGRREAAMQDFRPGPIISCYTLS